VDYPSSGDQTSLVGYRQVYSTFPWQYRMMQISPSPPEPRHVQHPGEPQHGCISAAVADAGCCTAASAKMASTPNNRVRVQHFCFSIELTPLLP
jgi:hypothetical protein